MGARSLSVPFGKISLSGGIVINDLDNAGHVGGCFVVGFRVLTSGSRRAIRRLSERLNIDVVPVESMIDQMGKVQGEAFYSTCTALRNRICKMPPVLLIWQIVIVDGSEQNLLQWHRLLQKSRWPPRSPTRRCARRSGFYVKWSRICRNLTRSRCAITPFPT